jgi:multidrug efflux pump subunit AcrA (membrane-fusion protein)
MRKIIIVLTGVFLLIGGYLIQSMMIDSKKAPRQKIDKSEKTAFVEEIQNTTIPITISSNGNLYAKNKVEIYSEVQGILQNTGKEFRPGVVYKKGQTILKINSEEHFANLQVQKSNLQNLVASILPDIRLDYPDSFENWKNYLSNFDVNKNVVKLPEPASEQEKYFITGKNIFSSYYNVKNLEARLVKYNIKAPFTGVLTEVTVNTGALVRSGQKMGELIDTSVFIVEIAIKGSYADLLSIGKEVVLNNLDGSKSWTGKVSRINGRVDERSQTLNIYIEVKGEGLKEGMYLTANVPAIDEENCFRISRKLLIANKAIYVVDESVLRLTEVEIVYFGENSAVIKGLKDGTKILSKTIPGAFDGMKVKIFN